MPANVIGLLALLYLFSITSASLTLCIKGCCDHAYPLPSKDLILTPLVVNDTTTTQHISLPTAELPCCNCEDAPKQPPHSQPGHPPKAPAIKLCGESACCPIDCFCQPDVPIDCSDALRAIHAINRNKTRSLFLLGSSSSKAHLPGFSSSATFDEHDAAVKAEGRRGHEHGGGHTVEGGLPANCPEGACDDSEFWPCICIQALVASLDGDDAAVAAVAGVSGGEDERGGVVGKLKESLQQVIKRAKGLVTSEEPGDGGEKGEKEEL